MISVLSGRATSAFPVSVGTSLAIESVFDGGGASIDVDRVIPQHIKINDYHEFWFNLSTLFRNLHASVPRSDVTNVRAEDCAEALVQELELLVQLTIQQSNNFTKPVLYVCNYKGLESKYRHAGIRRYTTEKQKAYKALHDAAIQRCIQLWPDMNQSIRILDMSLPGVKQRALIMTHVPYDLLSHRYFERLDLLESHTGLLKRRNLWYTKYYNGKEYPTIPFSRHLLPVFGDNEFFHPMSASLRTDIVTLAKTAKWTFATTDDKILADLKTLKNPYAIDLIQSMTV